MLKALQDEDYKTSSVEMLDSRWAKQTPNRANRMAERMANISYKKLSGYMIYTGRQFPPYVLRVDAQRNTKHRY